MPFFPVSGARKSASTEAGTVGLGVGDRVVPVGDELGASVGGGAPGDVGAGVGLSVGDPSPRFHIR